MEIAGEDYQSNIESFMLSSLSEIGTASVNILNDEITEQTESFGARIIIPEETRRLGIDLGTPSTIIVTITDDDGKIIYANFKFSLFTNCVEGDLEIICYTVYFSSNTSVQLFFEGNQEAEFSCAINNDTLQNCK